MKEYQIVEMTSRSIVWVESSDRYILIVREDDEIVEALNRYTVKLQASLTIINSTDM